MKQTKQDAKLLPIVELNGTEYVVDIERREFRESHCPQNSVGMHTEQGREMVKAMIGTEWRAFAIDGCLPRAEV